MYLTHRLVANLRERGLMHTVRVGLSVLADTKFDWQYGTDTRGRITPQALGITAPTVAQAVSYRPSKAAPLQSLLRQLNPPRESTFVDFGSGKGRALLIAAEYGFGRVIGVEFSHDLCGVARRNVALVSQQTRTLLPIEVVEADATEFEITPDQSVFFLFNPFRETVLSAVLRRIQHSVDQHPRPIWLIYLTPEYRSVVEASRVFTACRDYAIRGCDFPVFTRDR